VQSFRRYIVTLRKQLHFQRQKHSKVQQNFVTYFTLAQLNKFLPKFLIYRFAAFGWGEPHMRVETQIK